MEEIKKEIEKSIPQQYSTIICGESVKKTYEELTNLVREQGTIGFSFEKVKK
jgi:hypothetical protein